MMQNDKWEAGAIYQAIYATHIPVTEFCQGGLYLCVNHSYDNTTAWYAIKMLRLTDSKIYTLEIFKTDQTYFEKII